MISDNSTAPSSYEVRPLQKRSDFGALRVPGSKSLSNRALCLAAFAEGKSELRGILLSDDSLHCIESIKELGVRTELDEEARSITLWGGRSQIRSEARCYVGSAGTAARFLSAMLAMLPGAYRIDASEQMRRRPMKELVSVLEQGGVEFSYEGEKGHLPFTLRNNSTRQNSYTVNCDRSSQFLSAMLMAAAVARHDVEIHVAGDLVARPYVDMTLEILKRFGVSVLRDSYRRFTVSGSQTLRPQALPIEPDVSSACYFFSVPALLGGSITVERLSFASLQGDIQFLDVLRRMGCLVEEVDGGIRVSRTGEPLIGGFEVDMNEYSDQALTLAVLATSADAPVSIRNIGHVQFQESSRIQVCATELRKLGARVDADETGMTVYPAAIHGGLVETYDDHRMAMSFALLGLKTEGLVIADPLCCRKTYPDYFKDLEALYE